jgi:hypothetical protein
LSLRTLRMRGLKPEQLRDDWAGQSAPSGG